MSGDINLQRKSDRFRHTNVTLKITKREKELQAGARGW